MPDELYQIVVDKNNIPRVERIRVIEKSIVEGASIPTYLVQYEDGSKARVSMDMYSATQQKAWCKHYIRGIETLEDLTSEMTATMANIMTVVEAVTRVHEETIKSYCELANEIKASANTVQQLVKAMQNTEDDSHDLDSPQRLEVACTLSFDVDDMDTEQIDLYKQTAVDNINATLQHDPFGLGARLEIQ